jgi:hypothetical protein
MPLLSIVLQRSNAGKHPVSLFGTVQKQRIILTSYSIKYADNVSPTGFKFLVKLPFLTNYDVNSNAVIQGAIPIYMDILADSNGVANFSQFTYKECNYIFNLSRNLNDNFSDYTLYTEDGIEILDHYVITLNFTYGLEELI